MGKAASKSTSEVPGQSAIKVTGEIEGGIIGAQTKNSVVVEPGSLTISVEGQAQTSVPCITDVRAWVYSGGALTSPTPSTVDTSKIKLASSPKVTNITLHVSFPKSAVTGTWYLTSVTAIACGTKPVGWNAEWQGYESFTVKR
jgi:hypothetical protein